MSQIEPQEDVDYDDVFESIMNDAKKRGLSDDQAWNVWQTGLFVPHDSSLVALEKLEQAVRNIVESHIVTMKKYNWRTCDCSVCTQLAPLLRVTFEGEP